MLYKISKKKQKNKTSTNNDIIGAGLGALGLSAIAPSIQKKEMKIHSRLYSPELTVDRHNIQNKAYQYRIDENKKKHDEALQKIKTLEDDLIKGNFIKNSDGVPDKDLHRKELDKYRSQKIRAELNINLNQGFIENNNILNAPRIKYYNKANKIYNKVRRLRIGAQAGATGLGLYAIGKALYNAYHSNNDDENIKKTTTDKYIIPSGALLLSAGNMVRGGNMYFQDKKFNPSNKIKAEKELKNIFNNYKDLKLDSKEIDEARALLYKLQFDGKINNSVTRKVDKLADFLKEYKKIYPRKVVGAGLFGLGGVGAALSSLLIAKNAHKDAKANKKWI